LLTEEEKTLIDKDADRGFLPLRVLNPIEDAANKHFAYAVNQAETMHEDDDDCNYPFSPENERLRLEFNVRIHEVINRWETRYYGRKRIVCQC